MAMYDAEGNALTHVYDAQGNALTHAYDAEGNVIFSEAFAFKVMQYNCGQWYIGDHDNVPSAKDSEYFNLQSGIIQNVDADIILLEEYTAQFSKTGRTALSMLEDMYPYYHEQTDGTTTTVTQRAIYSKYPISNYATHAFNDGSGYYFDTCDITISGLTIHFIYTHLHWNDISKRASEASVILADANQYDYVVIGGDFNTADNFSTSGADYIAVLKQFADAGYKLASGGDFGFLKTYSSGSSVMESCLDNIIISPTLAFASVTVDHTKETDGIPDVIDHEPMIAVIEQS